MSVPVVSISKDRFPPDDAGARSRDSHIMPLAKTDDVPLARHHDPTEDPTDRIANGKARSPT